MQGSRAHWDEPQFKTGQFVPRGQARERVVFQGGVNEGGVVGRRQRPMTVGSDGRAPGSGVDRSRGDAERIQRAREEAIRATLENINGWGT